MDGILIIDKPAGLTSHDVVAQVRRLLKTKRVGHTGTLDPFATGVLVLLIGRATRLARFIDKDEKEYEADVNLGWETDTGDRTGKRRDHDFAGDISAGAEILVEASAAERALVKFRGSIRQTPPMYSAKKVKGKKLYELARCGIEIERRPIAVDIRRLDLLDFGINYLKLKVVCSAGTYIRTLAEDIGRELRVGAHLRELRRTRAGKFTLSHAVTIEQMNAHADRAAVLLPLSEAVSHLAELRLTADRVEKIRSGLASRFSGRADDGDAVRILAPDGELIAVGTYDASENAVRPKIVLV